jgi:hypothetical protein
MTLGDDMVRFMKGDEFSSGILFRIARPENRIIYRMDYIEKLVLNRKIIHLGCADHVSSIQKKLARNKWFHKRLSDCAERCLGIDINPEGIQVMKKLGFQDVVLADILRGEVSSEIRREKWDYMVMGEILEHQDNPEVFLEMIGQRYNSFVERLVVSTPNAFRYLNFTSALRHQEKINTDHRYWFTPYTLGKIGTRAGLEIDHFQFCQSFVPPPHHLFQRILLTFFPALRDDIVMVFNLKKHPSD